MAGGNGLMREVLLHGGADEAFDRSVAFARRLAETFGARLHILYTVQDPLSAGWTAEMSPDRMPEVHQAMETEARERLTPYISPEDQDRLGVQIAIRMGPAADELVRYTESHDIDLAILHAPTSDEAPLELARALLDGGRCSILILR